MKGKRRKKTVPAVKSIPKPGWLRRFGEAAAGFFRTPAGLAAAGIFTLGTAVRLVFIDVPIRYDEAFTFTQFARHPVAEFIGNYSFPNNHLLHTLLVHASVSLFGPWEWAIRLPAFLAGVAGLPLIYRLGRRAGDQMTGLWAMALAAGSSALVEYSTNGRGYTMVVFFTALLLFTALRIGTAQRSWKDWIFFCLAGIAGMYTIPVMLYPLAAAFLWTLGGADRDAPAEWKRLILPLTVAGAAIVAGTLLCYLPVILKSGLKSLTANRFVQPQTWSQMAGSVPALPGEIFSYFNQYLPLPLKVVIVIAFLAGIVRLPRLAVAAVIATGGLMAIQRVVPVVRVFTFGLVIYFLAAAAGISWLIEAAWLRTGRKPVALWAFPLAWAAAAVVTVYLVRGPEASIDRFPEARVLAEFMTRNYGKDANFIASVPANETILYYGTERGETNFGTVWEPNHPPEITHFVVNRRLNDLESFQNESKHRFLFFNPPRLVTVVDSAELYEAESVIKQGIKPGAMIQSYFQQLKASGTIDSTEFLNAQLAALVLYHTAQYGKALELCLMLQRKDSRNKYILNMLGMTY